MTESGVPLEASIPDGAVALESILCPEELASHRPQVLDGQRVRALRFAPLLGLAPTALTSGRVTYDLRRLRLCGLIERIATTHRYRVTQDGLRLALFFTRTYARLLPPWLARLIGPNHRRTTTPSAPAFDRLEAAVDHGCAEAKLVA